MSTTTGADASTEASPSSPASRSLLSRVDWRRYIIYIGFVVVFLAFFALLGRLILGNRGSSS